MKFKTCKWEKGKGNRKLRSSWLAHRKRGPWFSPVTRTFDMSNLDRRAPHINAFFGERDKLGNPSGREDIGPPNFSKAWMREHFAQRSLAYQAKGKIAYTLLKRWKKEINFSSPRYLSDKLSKGVCWFIFTGRENAYMWWNFYSSIGGSYPWSIPSSWSIAFWCSIYHFDGGDHQSCRPFGSMNEIYLTVDLTILTI